MFCVNCGNEIADGARFCPKCGAVQGQSSQPSYSAPQQEYRQNSSAPQQNYAPYNTPAPNNQKKTPMGLIIGIIAAVVVVIALVIVFVVVKPGSSKDKAPAEEPSQTETAPDAAAEPAPEDTGDDTAEAPAGPGGHYILTEAVEDGETFGTDLIAYFGGESYLDMNDDGTFYLLFYPEDSSLEGTWADGTLTVDSGALDYVYDADAMTITIDDEEDGLSLVFTHESVAPEIEYIVMDDGDGELTESDYDDGSYYLYDFGIDETVIYDDGGVTVTLTGIEDDGWNGYDINYTVTNSSDKTILVESDYVIINGCVIREGMYTDVAPGKNANDYVYISYDELESAGLTQFYELDIQADILDYDSYDEIGSSGLLSIYVDEDAMVNGYDADPLPEGELVFDDGGIQLYYICLENDGWDDGDGYARFILVNNSGHELWAYADDTSYNGWMVSDSFGVSEMPSGYWTICSLYVTNYEDANLNSYEEITDLEFTLSCKDADDWSRICDDTTISLSVTPIPR